MPGHREWPGNCEAVNLWESLASKEIVLCLLLEHFTLHWEAIKTITRSLVRVILFLKIQNHLPRVTFSVFQRQF